MATNSIKEVFEAAENGTLTWEQFQEATKDCKFVDLNSGDYVSKKKFNDELASRDKQLESLNSTIAERDTNLEDLKQQLLNAGTDAEKLKTLSLDMQKLQDQYADDIQEYEERLKKQEYEFAVKDFANTKEFSSAAAKRDFISNMIAKELKMDGGRILGADDFVNAYSTDNADAFVTHVEPKSVEPEPAEPKPMFVTSTPGGEPVETSKNPFLEAFHFTNFVRNPEN